MKEATLAWSALNAKELHPLLQSNGSWESQRAGGSGCWEDWAGMCLESDTC